MRYGTTCLRGALGIATPVRHLQACSTQPRAPAPPARAYQAVYCPTRYDWISLLPMYLSALATNTQRENAGPRVLHFDSTTAAPSTLGGSAIAWSVGRALGI